MRSTISRLTFPALLTVLAACQTERTLLPPATESGEGIRALAFGAERTPWSEPVRLDAPVNDPLANEQGPAISPDGLSLYFCSNRPGGSGGNDLWAARRASEAEPWTDAVNLGATVNSVAGDCGPSFSQDGLLLFFTSNRAGGAGANDIYMVSRTDPTDDLSWGPPVRLGPEVNTAAFEFSPFITRWSDEGTAQLYFERGASNATGDIFVVTLNAAGMTVGSAVAVAELNGSGGDARPTVRFDGREVMFASNRAGGWDLYMASRNSPNEAWSAPVLVDQLSVNTLHEIHPYLSRDGRTVFFVRGTGVANDIWMATRTPSGR